jgi:hypothetical protein
LRFSETLKLSDPGLVVSKRHEAWITGSDHPPYSQRAIDFAQAQLGKADRKREGTLSASSLNECGRYQQFVYLGMPKLMPDAKNAAKMANGSFMHLRWQMEGLTEGWLRFAEVALEKNQYGLAGTMDGVLYEDSVLELKSINTNGFSRVASFGPLVPHMYQMATYLLCSGAGKGVFIYECKDNQEYTEIVLTRDQLPLDEVAHQAEVLHGSVEGQDLIEPLEDCIDGKGWKYASCPYRDRCMSVHTWEEAHG